MNLQQLIFDENNVGDIVENYLNKSNTINIEQELNNHRIRFNSGFVVRGRSLQLFCNISANPTVNSRNIFWYKDSMLIQTNQHNDSIINNETSASKLTFSK